MKESIKVKVEQPQYLTDTGVVFGQVPSWCGHTVENLKMDIVFPMEKEKKYPCIVWICGGAWKEMSTSAHLAYLSRLAMEGFVVASVQYRTSNQVIFPAQLEDIKAAVRYLRAHSEQYSIQEDAFGVMGESAGAHLAAMTALTGDREEWDKGWYLDESSAVQAACTWYLPSDMEKMIERTADYMKAAAPESLLIGGNASVDKEKAAMASPVSYVSPAAPPFLMFHGTDDRTVPFSQSQAMYEKLEAAGAQVSLVAIEGADHADVHFFQKEIWDRIICFFQDKLK